MVLENIIINKLSELKSQVSEYRELENDESADNILFAIDVLNEVLEQYNNGE